MLIRVAILTISDRAFSGERADASGPALAKVVEDAGWKIIEQHIVPDDFQKISDYLVDCSDNQRSDLILTTGGTGFAQRDITPEATLSVLEKSAPGLVELIRQKTAIKNPNAHLSRAVAGIRKRSIIVNLPGSPAGAVESFAVILPILEHAISILQGDAQAEQQHVKLH